MDQNPDTKDLTKASEKRKPLPTMSPLPRNQKALDTPPPSKAPDASEFSNLPLNSCNGASSLIGSLDPCLEKACSENTFGSSPGSSSSQPRVDYTDCQLGSGSCKISDRSRTRKVVTWAPEVVFINHTQMQLQKYLSLDLPKEIDWWEIQTEVDAFAATLRSGKLLKAVQDIPSQEMNRIADGLPVSLMSAVKKVTSDIRGNMAEDYDIRSDNGDDELELVTYRRELLQYLDTRLDNLMFCRYDGCMVEPDTCPRSEMQRQGINDVYELGPAFGPAGHIVNDWDRSDRPLAWPICFSQAYMAMKYDRVGKDGRLWVSSLSTHLAYSVLGMANHWWSSVPLLRDDRLLVRTQSWIYIPNLDATSRKYAQSFMSGAKMEEYAGAITSDQITWSCRHLNAAPHLKPMYDFENPDSTAYIRNCTECAMEYQIDTLKSIPILRFLRPNYMVSNNAFCALITVWRDFGRCLTPYDPRWQAHFIEYERDEFRHNFPADEQIARSEEEEECATDWPVGGIRRAFEGVDEYMDFEYALDENSQVRFLVSGKME